MEASGAFTPKSADRCILVVDRDELFKRTVRKKLTGAGFEKIECFFHTKQALFFLEKNRCDLIFLDIGDSFEEEGVRFLERVRANGFQKNIAVLSSGPSKRDLIKAAFLGVNDFLVKSIHLDIVSETKRLLNTRRSSGVSDVGPDIFEKTGFMRSMGLSVSDIKLLKAYSRGFPKYTELAERTRRSGVQVRKQFSEIYKKLHENFDINNPAQLSSLITVLSLLCESRLHRQYSVRPTETVLNPIDFHEKNEELRGNYRRRFLRASIPKAR